MTGPEGYNSSNTLEAEGWVSPEGYNVDDLEQAIAYLSDIHGLIVEQSDPKGETDLETGFHITFSLANIDRAVGPRKDDERRQSVAEHSFNLTHIGLNIIDKYNLPLDKLLFVELVPVHDSPEIYGLDSVVGNPEHEATKPYRERAGYTILRDRYKDDPRMLSLLGEIANPTLPETKFLKDVDKVEPFFYARATKCATQIELGESFETFVSRVIPKIFHNKLILYEYALPIIDDIGRKWESWGGEPIGRKHMAIVNNSILAHQVKVHESEAEEDILVSVPKERWSVQRVAMKALQAFEEGEATVTNLSKWRDEHRPQPPTPSPTPATGIALAV